MYKLLLLAASAYAYCPNGCSGHGSCGADDRCTCHLRPNNDTAWQAADCSERTCPKDTAWVKYPVAGHNDVHGMAECSNQGSCDRKSGECDCFPGYSGAGCQKAACGDATCSGHGVCMSAQDLAAADHGNVYNLWDSEVTMGCKCEPGYSGPTCESKMCKHGLDPLYIDDDYMTIRAPTARVLLQYVNVTGNLEAMDELGNADADGDLSTGLSITGTYAIKFYDAFGEDYQTDPLAATAGCIEIKAALESMANDIVPAGSVICSEITPNVGSLTARNKVEYDLTFTENLGDLKPIEINANLDGTRPSVYAIGHSGTDDNKVKFDVDVKVLANARGISGENIDYFPTMCDGVTLQATAVADAGAGNSGGSSEVEAGGFAYASGTGFDAAAVKLLKACLGDADGDASNNLEVYNWDYGLTNTTWHPHVVKLTKTPTAREDASGVADDYDAGKYYLAYYGAGKEGDATERFYFSGLPEVGVDMSVFTTDGTATVLANRTSGQGRDSNPSGNIDRDVTASVTARFAKYSTTVYTSADVSCDSNHLNACLNKGDKVLLPYMPVAQDGVKVSVADAAASANTGNLYTVVKVGVDAPSASTGTTEDRFYFVVDKAINWDGSATAARSAFRGSVMDEGDTSGATAGTQLVGIHSIVKFEPGPTSYEFVQQCSGRGLCNGDDGLCECFTGYTSDNCDQQSALAV